MKHTLGDAPIEPALYDKMNDLGRRIGAALSDNFGRKWGFVLMVFPLNDHGGRCNYISNANREDVTTMLKEQIKRFEGQPDIEGHA